jgi:hypothetical protein
MTESSGESNDTASHDASASAVERAQAAMASLRAHGDAGASWFYWVAGLSLVNTAITHLGGDRRFIVGLAVTTIADLIATEVGKQQPDVGTIAMIVSVSFSVFIAGVAILFGWLSRHRYLWIYGIGMFIYLLDGLIYLLFEDLMSAGFHGYVLYCMFHGIKAYRSLNKLEATLTNHGSESTETKQGQSAGFDQTPAYDTRQQ